MKKFVVVFMILLTTVASAQVVSSNNLEKGKFESYIAYNGDTIEVGDTLIIGKASNDNGFIFITQDGKYMHASHSGKIVVIDRVEVFDESGGLRAYLRFKGFGLIAVYVDYDNAHKSLEIINRNGLMNSRCAISKMADAELLQRNGIITNKQFEDLKKTLMPSILSTFLDY